MFSMHTSTGLGAIRKVAKAHEGDTDTAESHKAATVEQ